MIGSASMKICVATTTFCGIKMTMLNVKTEMKVAETRTDINPAKNVQDEFMELFSANQTGMGAGPQSFGLARWSLPFFTR